MIIGWSFLELDDPAVVGVSNHRCGSIGLQIRLDKHEHAAQEPTELSVNDQSCCVSYGKEQREYLEYQPVIPNRALIIDAIFQNLSLHFFYEARGTIAAPTIGLSKLRNAGSDYK